VRGPDRSDGRGREAIKKYAADYLTISFGNPARGVRVGDFSAHHSNREILRRKLCGEVVGGGNRLVRLEGHPPAMLPVRGLYRADRYGSCVRGRGSGLRTHIPLDDLA
jgi:hypothetical protein